MRRQVLIRIVVACGIVLGIGLTVWASTQGFLGPYAKARHLIVLADRAVAQGQWPEAQAHLEALVTTYPDSPVTAEGLLKLGRVQDQQQHLADARAMYRLLLEHFPASPQAQEAQAQLGAVNVALLFSPVVTETDTAYVVQPGDTIGAIAARHHTTVEVLRRANTLKGDVIRPKQKLKIPGGTFTIVVDKSQNQLLLSQNNAFFKLYPVATGKDGSTPVGTFKIVNKITNPVWYRQGAMVPAESPENILGTRWLGWDKKGYGIHGSVDPGGIGKQVTAGCVRMHNQDVEELFAIVPTGTEVTVVD